MRVKIVSPAAVAPLTRDEVKEQIGIDASDTTTIGDTRLDRLIEAAAKDAYSQTGLFMTDTAIEVRIDQFPRDGVRSIRIPGGEIKAATVNYTPAGGSETAFAQLGNWFLDNSEPNGSITLELNVSWPSTTLRPRDAVRITATAGYGAAADCPEIFKQAMLLQIATWVELTEDQAEPLVPGAQLQTINRTSQAIYSQYAVKGFSYGNETAELDQRGRAA